MIELLNPYKWALAIVLTLSVWVGHAYYKHRAVESAEQAVRD